MRCTWREHLQRQLSRTIARALCGSADTLLSCTCAMWLCAPAQGMATEHVRAAIQLEQWLMEGAYNKVCARRCTGPLRVHSSRVHDSQPASSVRNRARAVLAAVCAAAGVCGVLSYQIRPP